MQQAALPFWQAQRERGRVLDTLVAPGALKHERGGRRRPRCIKPLICGEERVKCCVATRAESCLGGRDSGGALAHLFGDLAVARVGLEVLPDGPSNRSKSLTPSRRRVPAGRTNNSLRSCQVAPPRSPYRLPRRRLDLHTGPARPRFTAAGGRHYRRPQRGRRIGAGDQDRPAGSQTRSHQVDGWHAARLRCHHHCHVGRYFVGRPPLRGAALI